MKHTALILIDIQNIYFTEGPYKLFEPEKAAKQARKVLDYFRGHDMNVIHVQHQFNGSGYSQDKQHLNSIYPLVAPIAGEEVVSKAHPSSFLGTNLQECLQKNAITDVVVVGMMSYMCVDTTVRQCQNYGLSVTVLEDACTTKDVFWEGNKVEASVVNAVYMSGLNDGFATVMKTNQYLNHVTSESSD